MKKLLRQTVDYIAGFFYAGDRGITFEVLLFLFATLILAGAVVLSLHETAALHLYKFVALT